MRRRPWIQWRQHLTVMLARVGAAGNDGNLMGGEVWQRIDPNIGVVLQRSEGL